MGKIQVFRLDNQALRSVLMICLMLSCIFSSSAFADYAAWGKVNKVSTGTGGILTVTIQAAGGGKLSCLSGALITEDSLTTMTSILAAGRLIETAHPEGGTYMRCDDSLIINRIYSCAFGFQPNTAYCARP